MVAFEAQMIPFAFYMAKYELLRKCDLLDLVMLHTVNEVVLTAFLLYVQIPFLNFRKLAKPIASSNRPLKKCSSNVRETLISKLRATSTRLRSDFEGRFGPIAGSFAHFGRTYPAAHA